MNERSANWRLFGGGGLALGGLLATVGVILAVSGMSAVHGWLWPIGLLLTGIALFFVAFGQTGSNGAVGGSAWGKFVLVVAGAAAAVLGVLGLLVHAGVATPEVLYKILVVVFAVALVLSAIAIFGRGVAKGIAKWALVLPAVFAVLWAIDLFTGFVGLGFPWVSLLLAITILLTGLAYLFNKADIGR